MGINIGAFLAPLACGYLGMSENWGWHYGFGAAGIGMIIGLIFSGEELKMEYLIIMEINQMSIKIKRCMIKD